MTAPLTDAETGVPSECTRCGDSLSEEERNNPLTDVDPGDEYICTDCYHEHYDFTCFRCGECAPIKDQHKLLVIAESCGGKRRGVYRIVEFPYYTSDTFSMWWNRGALKRVGRGGVPFDTTDAEYPSGHLCAECQNTTVTELEMRQA